MTEPVRPPEGVVQALLDRALPSGPVGDAIRGDLLEEYVAISETVSPREARAWYRRQGGRILLAVATGRISREKRSSSFGFSWLDLRLGVRMLFKYPGLTLVGTLAMSVAITTVGGVHAFAEIFVGPHLPVPDGGRVVAIWNVDTETGSRVQQTLGDVLSWRREVESIEDIGAFVTVERVLSTNGGQTQSVRVAQISPAVFRMLRVPPIMGRPLTDADAQPGGTAVVLIGSQLWRSALAADPAVVGTSIRLGNVPHTVVGVMPEGFHFPINEQVWIAAGVPTSTYGPGAGPSVQFTVGRLAPGTTLDGAQAELDALGARLSAEYPGTHRALRPRVDAYTRSFADAEDPTLDEAMSILRVLILVVLIVAAVNVGTLVYARSAARVGEISIRTALGASRRRVAGQLFAEALVLASIAGALGFGATVVLVRWIFRVLASFDEGIPYWWDGRVGWSTLGLVVALVLASAALTGIPPALGVTGRGVRSRLQRVGTGDRGLSFGRAASTIVVAQVAISVAALTLAGTFLRPFLEDYAMDDGIARSEYLTAEVRLDRGMSTPDTPRDAAANFARNAEIWRELGSRVSREPDVLAVTFGTSFPGMEHPVEPFEAQGIPLARAGGYGHRSRVAWVEPGFFEAFDVPILSGRTFDAADVTGTEARVALVNGAFIRHILDGAEPIGQRVRLDLAGDGREGEWIEIVGVVPDLTVDMGSAPGEWPAMYFPLVGTDRPIHIAVRVADEPERLAGRLESMGQALDPALVVHRPRTLEEMAGTMVRIIYVFGIGTVLLVVAALVLATAGVYSLMSFTVAQRTREIGIRTALGANAHRVARDVFSRALAQVGAGTGLGLLIGWFGTRQAILSQGAGPIAGIVLIMLLMGIIACGYPVRRALRIQPTEALHEG